MGIDEFQMKLSSFAWNCRKSGIRRNSTMKAVTTGQGKITQNR